MMYGWMDYGLIDVHKTSELLPFDLRLELLLVQLDEATLSMSRPPAILKGLTDVYAEEPAPWKRLWPADEGTAVLDE